MECLTKRDEFGNADIIGVDSEELQCNLDFNEFNKVTNALNRLAEYEDLQEQNKLLILLCAVGDVVYEVDFVDNQIEKKRIESIEISECGISIYARDIFNSFDAYDISDFGESVFFIKQQAESALKET